MSQALAIEWAPGSVRVLALPRGETVVTVPVPAAIDVERHDLALFSDGILRVPSATREPFVRVGAGGWEPIARVPGEGPLSCAACRAHAGGVLTAIEDDGVWVLEPQSAWSKRPLPQGVRARDASLAPDGSLWIAGGMRRARGRPEAILVRLVEGGGEVLSPPLPAEDRRRLAEREADEQYWRLDMAGTPTLAVATCAWMLDDPTEFAVIGWESGWSVVATEQQSIRAWTRDRGLTLYTSEGRRHRLAGPTAPARSHDLRPAIQAAWPGGVPPGEVIVRAARARGDELLLAASIYDSRAALQASALFHSADDGSSFQPWAQTTGNGREILDAVWPAP